MATEQPRQPGDGETRRRTRAEGSLGDDLRQLADDSLDLMRQELALAKMEMQEMARDLANDAVRIAVALGVAGVGGLALTAFLVLVIGNLLGGAYWAGALIVGAVFLLIGGILAYTAVRDLRQRTFKPDETIETLKEDRDFAKRESDEFRRDVAA